MVGFADVKFVKGSNTHPIIRKYINILYTVASIYTFTLKFRQK